MAVDVERNSQEMPRGSLPIAPPKSAVVKLELIHQQQFIVASQRGLSCVDEGDRSSGGQRGRRLSFRSRTTRRLTRTRRRMQRSSCSFDCSRGRQRARSSLEPCQPRRFARTVVLVAAWKRAHSARHSVRPRQRNDSALHAAGQGEELPTVRSDYPTREGQVHAHPTWAVV